MRYIKDYKSDESYEEGDYVLAYRGKFYYSKIIDKDVNYVDAR